ncbi:glycosyltransferase [Pasteurella sp. PK-2025]|uniref:glycosyltransferase n=1 Tax=Pasteurella sp. PK-2025 TaxID=3413133 RepID=UPI003C74492D
MKKEKANVLIFTALYLPGVKGGGPIRTICNLISQLKEYINFKIITLDRDLGDTESYKNIEIGKWLKDSSLDNEIYYIKPDFKIKELINVINNTDYDIFYLNSFFNFKFTIIPLFLMKFNLLKKQAPIILAPRGELSLQALSIKKWKKLLFIKLENFFGLYNQDIVWQASSEKEKNDIYNFLKNNKIKYKKIIKCDNLSQSTKLKNEIDEDSDNEIVDKSTSKELRICYLSRIAKIKNLRYALEVLSNINFPVFFGIYGPLEDREYWDSCLEILKKLPSNIHIEYYGLVENKNVQKTISQYDLFFVPTQSENYGHVFIEALSSGTPILLSDNTPWRDLENKGIGWDLPLEDKSLFVDALNKYYHLDNDKRYLMKKNCIEFSNSMINNKAVLDANRNMFLDLL